MGGLLVAGAASADCIVDNVHGNCEAEGKPKAGHGLLQGIFARQAKQATGVIEDGREHRPVAALQLQAGGEMLTQLSVSVGVGAQLRYAQAHLKVINGRVQKAAKRMHRQWNTTVQQFDEVVEHLIDNSASSEDECTDKLTEAKKRLHDIHEKVTSMVKHVNESEERTEVIIKEITRLEDKLNGTKT